MICRMSMLALVALAGCGEPAGVTRVDEDLYRSGQLSQTELREILPQFGVQTVISLRDKAPGFEAAICNYSGVELIEVPVHKQGYGRLLEVFKTCRKPALVHCYWGKDRTGKAVEMWLGNRGAWK